MKTTALVAEIGSTTTVVTAFALDEKSRMLGQGVAPTTTDTGDVVDGLKRAMRAIRAIEGVGYDTVMATSSAAGGLSMSVHGLVYDMTARAAKEAALGAGAVVKMVTAGDLTRYDLEELDRIRPKIMLLAGGVDYGERDTAIRNARLLAERAYGAPVVYAGNRAAAAEVADIFSNAGVKLYVVDNVYPRIDELAVEPARKVIQDVFEEHITKAPGMDRIREIVDGPILPTPGAVMEACRLLHPALGDLCALDVGGATTDVHSVAAGSPEIQAILESPEPLAKRTVEGDLGIFANRHVIYNMVKDNAYRELGFDPEPVLDNLGAIPKSDRETQVAVYLARCAARIAISRHAGKLRHRYGPSGRETFAEGKDLTSVRYIIGTGGALIRLPSGAATLAALLEPGGGKELYPKDAKVVLDRDYIMASCGVLSRRYPTQASELLMGSLGVGVE